MMGKKNFRSGNMLKGCLCCQSVYFKLCGEQKTPTLSVENDSADNGFSLPRLSEKDTIALIKSISHTIKYKDYSIKKKITFCGLVQELVGKIINCKIIG